MRRPGSPDWFLNDITYNPLNEADVEALKHAQRVLRTEETGMLDGPTKARLRGFQGLMNIRMTGCLDLATAIKIDEVRNRWS